jgi:hypothetical protein
MELFKVESIAHADGGLAAVNVAPGNIIPVFNENSPGIIAVGIFDLRSFAVEGDGLFGQPPLDAVFAEAFVQVHVPRFVIAAKDAGKPALERHNRAVENAVGRENKISGDNWVPAGTPDNLLGILGSVFPRHVRNRVSN